MATNAASLVNFGTTGPAVGEFVYSIGPLTAPSYLPADSYVNRYLVSAYPALGNLIVPVITPVSYAATARTLPSGGPWISTAYGNGVFVAVGFTTSNAASSTDGITWTARTMPSISNWYHVAFGNGIFVAVSASATAMVATSTDGITWTQRTTPFGTNNSVCFGNGKFVTVGGGGGSMVSTDGINWTSGSFANGYTDVAYGNGVFVAVRDSLSNVCLVSVDGLTATETGAMPATTNYYAIEFGGGFFVAISRISGTMAARSTNGIDWVSSTLPTTAIWQNITYGNNSFLAIGTATNGATSPDGLTWTARTLSSSTSWRGATFGAGKFVITSGANGTTIAATIDYAVNATDFVIPVIAPITGTTAYVKAT